MNTRDPDSKRERLLAAARAEFSAHGLAGARIDRIARTAKCSAGLVYTYFGSKDELADAVLVRTIGDALEEAPVTTDDLPGWAGQLFDRNADHPELFRIATWFRLERGAPSHVDGIEESSHAKLAAIEAAQAAGCLPTHFAASELLALVIHLSTLWSAMPGAYEVESGCLSRETQRRVIVDAVAAIIEKSH
ncbi:MAG TPA: TetR family transcriptional regulator [Thermomicrobiales bacterium]|nr:TetR family transcriptional regulator [Thermomicrobiales bacterium]